MATTSPAPAIGVDIGGTGIKGAPVDLAAGALRGRAHPHPDATAGHARTPWPRS